MFVDGSSRGRPGLGWETEGGQTVGTYILGATTQIFALVFSHMMSHDVT